ncbi:MAG: HAD family hydrolase [Candidatus Andersenbacteria bacterium]
MNNTVALVKTREDAWALLTEYTQSQSLRKHALAVEAAMRYYARFFSGEEESWGMVGLLHDFDYEKYPSLDDHPYRGQAILEAQGYPEVIRRGIMAHAPHTGTSRGTPMEKAIYAVDELTGLIVAVTLVRPSRKLNEMDAAAVMKKMKQPAFAKGVNREDIVTGAGELGLTLEEHVKHVLTAMQGVATDLGL